jgi:hypothetical protein
MQARRASEGTSFPLLAPRAHESWSYSSTEDNRDAPLQ